jgi:hypothetical protein
MNSASEGTKLVTVLLTIRIFLLCWYYQFVYKTIEQALFINKFIKHILYGSLRRSNTHYIVRLLWFFLLRLAYNRYGYV